MRNKIAYIIFFLAFSFALKAQDAQFTQFYASPLYLNPAFTGLTYEHRFTATYRNQYPNRKMGFKTYMAAYDYNFSDANSGIGFIAMRDNAGYLSKLSSTLFGLNYAYRIKVNKYSEVRAGLSVGVGQEKIDNSYSSLIFNDELITGSSNSVEDTKGYQQQILYADLGVGGMYSTSNFWFGASAKHINRPDISLTGNPNRLPIYFTAHGGYRILFSEHGPGKTKMNHYVSICGNYYHQGKNDQLDVGLYYFKSLINLGIWYRGLPFKRYTSGMPNNESIALLAGIDLNDKGLKIGYSFDITISTLGLSSTKGAHEIALVYELAKKHKRNRRVIVSYPKF